MKVLIIGETCIDRFIYCETKRLCPEAPVPVLNPIECIVNNGMSGNVVANIKAIYPKAKITHICQEEIGYILKTRYVDKKTNHLFLRVDEEVAVKPVDIKKLKKYSKYDIVIVSDYNKGFIEEKTLLEIGRMSKLSILDTKRKLTKEMLENYSFVKLNESEYNNNSHIDKKYMKNCIITLGEKGTKYLGNNKVFPSPNPQQNIDVSGAGDTFTAAFIIKYFVNREKLYKELEIEGVSVKCIHSAIEFANKMSSIVVSKRGVATP